MKEIFKQKQIAFLQGREYEKKAKDKKNIIRVFRKIVEKFPKERKPDDGYGDEHNAGFNEALKEIEELILNEINLLK